MAVSFACSPPFPHDDAPRGQVDGRQGGGLLEGERVRYRHHVFDRNGNVLGVRPLPVRTDHLWRGCAAKRVHDDALPDAQAAHLRAERSDLACAVAAEDARHLLRRNPRAAQSGSRVEVQPVQRRRAHADEHVARSGLRLRHLAVLNHGGSPVVAYECCFQRSLSRLEYPLSLQGDLCITHRRHRAPLPWFTLTLTLSPQGRGDQTPASLQRRTQRGHAEVLHKGRWSG